MFFRFILPVFLFIMPVALQAEDKVKIKVRLLQASDKTMLGFSSFTTDRILEPQLQDLRTQLETLPYDSFKIVSNEKIVLPIKKSNNLALSNGHSVVLKPLSVNGREISLWLNWKDESGDCLLDTRMHFDSSEAMIAGTDHSPDSGLLLAINVRPMTED
jgi:hypothetical protein